MTADKTRLAADDAAGAEKAASDSTKVKQRRTGRKKNQSSGQAEIEFSVADGAAQVLAGKIVDLTEYGVGIETKAPLSVGALVTISSQFFAAGNPEQVRRQARVIHCRINDDGTCRNGFAFEDSAAEDRPDQTEIVQNGALPDYYETLQISASADTEMIQRVFRLMAQRYHPDNGETGNGELFRSILQAYRVLNDPEKRAAYDVRHRASKNERHQILSEEDTTDFEQERHLRSNILSLLYEARRKQPEKPSISVRDMEAALGCAQEGLEFSLWYLRGKTYISVTDGGRYVITPEGVDAAEDSRSGNLRSGRLLLQEARAVS